MIENYSETIILVYTSSFVLNNPILKPIYTFMYLRKKINQVD